MAKTDGFEMFVSASAKVRDSQGDLFETRRAQAQPNQWLWLCVPSEFGPRDTKQFLGF